MTSGTRNITVNALLSEHYLVIDKTRTPGDFYLNLIRAMLHTLHTLHIVRCIAVSSSPNVAGPGAVMEVAPANVRASITSRPISVSASALQTMGQPLERHLFSVKVMVKQWILVTFDNVHSRLNACLIVLPLRQ